MRAMILVVMLALGVAACAEDGGADPSFSRDDLAFDLEARYGRDVTDDDWAEMIGVFEDICGQDEATFGYTAAEFEANSTPRFPQFDALTIAVRHICPDRLDELP